MKWKLLIAPALSAGDEAPAPRKAPCLRSLKRIS